MRISLPSLLVRAFQRTVVAVCVAFLSGCGGAAPAEQVTVSRLSPQDLYRLHCSTCHGDGTGNGHVAQTLKVRPRNLKHRQWQTSVTDTHIRRVIRDGGKSANLSDQMPPFSEKLNEAELEALTSYIRKLGRT